MSENRGGQLVLEDGTTFSGELFGAAAACAGEVVFNTGMVGYNESLTDPSYRGQIMVMTYPLVGNYGVPDDDRDALDLPTAFESDAIQIRALVVANLSHDTSHYTARRSLDTWLAESGVTGLTGIDTRALTQHLRVNGSALGKIITDGADVPFEDPNQTNLVAQVSVREPRTYGNSGPRVLLIDTGIKTSIIRHLVQAGAQVIRVPWDHDIAREKFDGLFIGNGPGNPKTVEHTVEQVRRGLADRTPVFGICMGHQVLALAAGADTCKLRFGHRGHNQPCWEVGTRRCFITSQNHGFAARAETLPEGWREWFVNANDKTNEGIRHEYKPARSVQFHPEAAPGPVDMASLFDRFLEMIR